MYKASIFMEPIALRDHFVKIITTGATLYRRVNFFEAIPPFQALNGGALAAGIQSPKTPATNLDLWDEQFGQWRWFPLDAAQVKLWLPNGVGKWQLKNLQTAIDMSIVNRDPTLVSTEFYSWEDQRPSFEFVNYSGIGLLATRIVVMGYRYNTSEVTDKPLLDRLITGAQVSTPIVCTGQAS